MGEEVQVVVDMAGACEEGEEEEEEEEVVMVIVVLKIELAAKCRHQLLTTRRPLIVICLLVVGQQHSTASWPPTSVLRVPSAQNQRGKFDERDTRGCVCVWGRGGVDPLLHLLDNELRS